MKINELLTDVLWEGEVEGETFAFVIEEGLARFVQPSRGKRVRGKGLSFLGKASLVGLGAFAVDAYLKYKKNKRTTTTFFAKTQQERKLYKDIVKTLTNTGKYKKTKEKFTDGGILWVLKKA